MKKNILLLAMGLAISAVAAQAPAESKPTTALVGVAQAGKTKSETCGGCHGPDGNPSAPVFPKLAGQHPSYLTKQLREFRSQKRLDQAVMNAMAESLTDADIADISAWFGSNASKPEAVEKNELGGHLFRSGISAKSVPACAACHGPKGEGNPTSVYPAVGGQYSAYIAKSLHDYKSGERQSEIMQAIAVRLSDDEINAVSDYASGLH
ncbi:MAG: c-type cytochrome [Candidatus Methylumidiphilus sp.]